MQSIRRQKARLAKRRCKGFWGKLKCAIKWAWIILQYVIHWAIDIVTTAFIWVNLDVLIKLATPGKKVVWKKP
jgi:hypothetical protein